MDRAIQDWVNGYAARSEIFDMGVAFAAGSPLLKGMPVALIFLFLWHMPGREQVLARSKLLALLALSVVSIALGRAAALLLPFRLRPLHDEALGLTMPLPLTRDVLDGWSSFPSDHAVLFATFAAGYWMVNRWAGLLFTLHALLIIGFARVFLLYHYPSDILAGAVLGAAVALVLLRPLAALVLRFGLLDLAERWPQFFYPLLFVFLFQVVTMFSSARHLVSALFKLLT